MNQNLFLIAKLKSLINNSSLNKEEKNLWLYLFFKNINNFNTDTLILLLDFLQLNQNNLSLLTTILKGKINFLKNGNLNNLNKLIQEEEKILKLIK